LIFEHHGGKAAMTSERSSDHLWTIKNNVKRSAARKKKINVIENPNLMFEREISNNLQRFGS
jgi:hypothetical protein